MANGRCSTCKCILTSENCSPSVLKHGSRNCRACRNENTRNRYRHDSEFRKRDSVRHRKRWVSFTSEQKKEAADKSFFYKYGVTREGFETRLSKQNNRCAICRREIFWSVSKRRSERACQDHDHLTKKLRDILCTNCNLMLGYSEDNEEILLSAVRYLRKHTESSTTQTQSVNSERQDSCHSL